MMGEDLGSGRPSGPAAGPEVHVQAISIGGAEQLCGRGALPGREVADDDLIAVDGPVPGHTVRGISAPVMRGGGARVESGSIGVIIGPVLPVGKPVLAGAQ